MKFAEMMFYAESEGLLPTRLGKLNAIVKRVNSYPYLTVPFEDFKEIVEDCGLAYEELTDRDKEYIDNHIR